MQGGNIEASSAHRLAQTGLLAAEATMRHRADLSARLQGAGEVLTVALVVAVPLGILAAAAAAAVLEVLMEVRTEEAAMAAEVEEVTGKPEQ